MSQPDIIKLRMATLQLDKGIIYVTYHKGDLNIEDAREIALARQQLSNGKPTPVLVDDRGMKSMTKEARDYLAGTEGQKLVKAGAILAKSGFAAVMANFFFTGLKIEFSRKIIYNKRKSSTMVEQLY